MVTVIPLLAWLNRGDGDSGARRPDVTDTAAVSAASDAVVEAVGRTSRVQFGRIAFLSRFCVLRTFRVVPDGKHPVVDHGVCAAEVGCPLTALFAILSFTAQCVWLRWLAVSRVPTPGDFPSQPPGPGARRRVMHRCESPPHFRG